MSVYDATHLGPTTSFGLSVAAPDLSIDPESIYGKGWNVPGTRTAAPSAARAAYLAQLPSAMTDDEAEWLGSPRTASKPFPMPLAVGMLGVVGVVGFVFFRGGASRKNPRRGRLTPLLALAGGAAGLWWLGRQAAAQVRAIVPTPAAETAIEGCW